MGFDKNSSLFTFFIGAITSLNLINSDNINFKDKNLITGKILLILYGLKLLEYFIWFDDKCEYGINESANIMGGLIDNMVPSMLFILFTIKKGTFDNSLTYINAAYIFYVIFNYFSFLKNDKLCTKVKPGQTIVYGWNDNFNFAIYLFVLAFNIFRFYDSNQSYLIFFSIFAILLINKIKKADNVKILGLITSFTPLLISKYQNNL